MKITQLLAEGKIGDVYQASVRLRPDDGRGAGAYLSRQLYFKKMERLLIRETASHIIDLFRYFFGELSSAHADLPQLNSHLAGEYAG